VTAARRTGFALAALLALAACSGEEDAQDVPMPGDVPRPACESVVFEDASLTLCTADPAQHTLHTVLKPAKGANFRSLTAYAASRPATAQPVAFAMNAGMFDDKGDPIGYYVEEGERLHDLNRAQGPGNFHMQPNGVFFGTGDKWDIRTSQDFFDNVTARPEFGTQSGPMLVVDGEIHPEIDPDGESLRIRNAVGIDAKGRALFVISDEPVSFGKLARFYRDVLKTPDALFLDGTVSSLWDPGIGRLDSAMPIGPLIVVEKRAKAAGEAGPE
jgi:uncharacterized protein YigE (DUF2233 family)